MKTVQADAVIHAEYGFVGISSLVKEYKWAKMTMWIFALCAQEINSMETPKTLNQAIANALTEMTASGYKGDTAVRLIKAHVKDYLSQKFGAVMLDTASSFSRLWESILKE